MFNGAWPVETEGTKWEFLLRRAADDEWDEEVVAERARRVCPEEAKEGLR